MRPRNRRAFTLIELLVVIAIIALLISVLLPALGKMRLIGWKTISLSNLRNIGFAAAAYQESNQGWLPLFPPRNGRGMLPEFIPGTNTRNPLKKWYLQKLAQRLQQFEKWMLHRFDGVAAITEADQQRLRRLGCPEPVVFVPAGVDLNRFRRDSARQPRPRTLFMIGSFDWLPNQEGLDWFLREVWPAARAQFPELELHLAGKNLPERFAQLQVPGVTVHGFVESAAAFMQEYELMLVPLLSGGGMRIKIIEGMALGKCILSTGLGAEGIHVRPGFDIVLGDSPEEWLTQLGRYYRGELGQQAIGEEAARTIARLYDNRRVVESFLDLYTILQPAPRVAAS